MDASRAPEQQPCLAPVGTTKPKIISTQSRLYIGVRQVKAWLGETQKPTPVTVEVEVDGVVLPGHHLAEVLYNGGAHYYWVTSRTLKQVAMGQVFVGWRGATPPHESRIPALALLITSLQQQGPGTAAAAAGAGAGAAVPAGTAGASIAAAVGGGGPAGLAPGVGHMAGHCSWQQHGPGPPGLHPVQGHMASMACEPHAAQGMVHRPGTQLQPQLQLGQAVVGPHGIMLVSPAERVTHVPPGSLQPGIPLAAVGQGQLCALQQQQQQQPGCGPAEQTLPSEAGAAAGPLVSAAGWAADVAVYGDGVDAAADVEALNLPPHGVPHNVHPLCLHEPAAALVVPPEVSALLPAHVLPAAVYVRLMQDGQLQGTAYDCQLRAEHDDSEVGSAGPAQPRVWLLGIPCAALEGRRVEQWRVGGDGCLVMCIRQAGRPAVEGCAPGVSGDTAGAADAGRAGSGGDDEDDGASARGEQGMVLMPESNGDWQQQQQQQQELEEVLAAASHRAPGAAGATAWDHGSTEDASHHQQQQSPGAAMQHVHDAAGAAADCKHMGQAAAAGQPQAVPVTAAEGAGGYMFGSTRLDMLSRVAALCGDGECAAGDGDAALPAGTGPNNTLGVMHKKRRFMHQAAEPAGPPPPAHTPPPAALPLDMQQPDTQAMQPTETDAPVAAPITLAGCLVRPRRMPAVQAAAGSKQAQAAKPPGRPSIHTPGAAGKGGEAAGGGGQGAVQVSWSGGGGAGAGAAGRVNSWLIGPGGRSLKQAARALSGLAIAEAVAALRGPGSAGADMQLPPGLAMAQQLLAAQTAEAERQEAQHGTARTASGKAGPTTAAATAAAKLKGGSADTPSQMVIQQLPACGVPVTTYSPSLQAAGAADGVGLGAEVSSSQAGAGRQAVHEDDASRSGYSAASTSGHVKEAAAASPPPAAAEAAAVDVSLPPQPPREAEQSRQEEAGDAAAADAAPAQLGPAALPGAVHTEPAVAAAAVFPPAAASRANSIPPPAAVVPHTWVEGTDAGSHAHQALPPPPPGALPPPPCPGQATAAQDPIQPLHISQAALLSAQLPVGTVTPEDPAPHHMHDDPSPVTHGWSRGVPQAQMQAHGADGYPPAPHALAAHRSSPCNAWMLQDKLWLDDPRVLDLLELPPNTLRLPHPLLLQVQVDGVLQQAVHLAELREAAGMVHVYGAPLEGMRGLWVARWSVVRHLSHRILVPCLYSDSSGSGGPGRVSDSVAVQLPGWEELSGGSSTRVHVGCHAMAAAPYPAAAPPAMQLQLTGQQHQQPGQPLMQQATHGQMPGTVQMHVQGPGDVGTARAHAAPADAMHAAMNGMPILVHHHAASPPVIAASSLLHPHAHAHALLQDPGQGQVTLTQGALSGPQQQLQQQHGPMHVAIQAAGAGGLGGGMRMMLSMADLVRLGSAHLTHVPGGSVPAGTHSMISMHSRPAAAAPAGHLQLGMAGGMQGSAMAAMQHHSGGAAGVIRAASLGQPSQGTATAAAAGGEAAGGRVSSGIKAEGGGYESGMLWPGSMAAVQLGVGHSESGVTHGSAVHGSQEPAAKRLCMDPQDPKI